MDFSKTVKEELSGSIARSYVAQISRFHRIQGSTMYHDAAEYVRHEAKELGLKDAKIERFVADGEVRYWTYRSPVGWTVRHAELRLLEPENRLLARYEDIPQSLHTFSNGTPRDGVTARLVDVGSGMKPEDYKGKSVKGKIVLATGKANRVHEEAVVRRGAAGVITDSIAIELPHVRETLDLPDAHSYNGIWPKKKDIGKIRFGFSLSKRQGNHIRKFLSSGKKVKLLANVDAKLFTGWEEVVTATIPGTSKSKDEVFVIAHLCHPKPSANDNASGSGTLLEIARTIMRLIESSKIKRPLRTIRFLWVPETLGTAAYLERHTDVHDRFVAGVNLDMVGQDQELCGSTLNLTRTPDSLPSYLNDFVLALIEQSVTEYDKGTAHGSASTFRYVSTTFSAGSDHAEFDEATVAVPCVSMTQWPDLFYHTSEDTIDKVSEDSLKRVGWITTMAALMLANADISTAYRLASKTAAKGLGRISEEGHAAAEEFFEKSEDRRVKNKSLELARSAEYHRIRLQHVIWREQQAVRSVRRLVEDAELDAVVERHCRDIASHGRKELAKLAETAEFVARTAVIRVPSSLEETEAEKEAKKLVPRRMFKGTLDLEILMDTLGEKEYEWYTHLDETDFNSGNKLYELLNFMDGKRSLHEIVNAVSSEYSPMDTEVALRFVRDLEKSKLLKLV
jgi:hypothetical protein